MKVKVRVVPNARKETFECKGPLTFNISVRQKAKNNAANRRVVQLIALHFGVPVKHVRIESGHLSPSKMLSIRR